jgi:hypothetical protein
MNTTSTRAGRVQLAEQLRTALRRTPGAPGPDDGATPGPLGNCGRSSTESCGMIDPQECAVHADVPADDPALLSYSGTLQMRRDALRVARRYGLR